MKNILIVKNLNYKILNNISFSLDSNTITALIGTTGSGKTTLLKCLSGISEYSGEIIINNNISKKNDILNEKIGLYLGTINLSTGTVLSNLIEPLNNLERDNCCSKEVVYEISKKLGIYNLITRDIGTLSYSEKKVVSFAKSVVHGPNILLIDDIFNSLDTYYKDKIIKYLESFRKLDSHIIIFITNESEDLMVADNIMILNDGKLIKMEVRDKILEKENLFTKNNLKLPFIIDLSHKLKDYNLIEGLVYNVESMVDEIWK